jgi:hypothetical protein
LKDLSTFAVLRGSSNIQELSCLRKFWRHGTHLC